MKAMPALVAGIIYAFAGFLARHMHVHIDIFSGFVWLPLIMALFHLAVTRRRPVLAVAAGLVLGMTALIGHLPPPVYSTLVLVAYGVYLAYARWRQAPAWRERAYPLLLLAVAGVFALGVAAVQMLPSLEYEPLVLKWTGAPEIDPVAGTDQRPYWVAGGLFYLHPENIVSFLMPHVYEPAERSAYLGIFTLGLVFMGVAARKRNGNRFFALLALIAFLFALGGQSIVHGMVWLALPFMDKVRVAVRSLLVVSFSCALLAAWGMEALLEGGGRTRRLVANLVHYGGLALGGLVLAGIGLAVWGSRQSPSATLDPYFSFVIMLLLAWAVIALWRPLRLSPRLWYAIAIGVLLFDLLSYSTNNFQPISAFDGDTNYAPEVYYRENGALRFLRQQPGYFRVDNVDNVLPPNFGDFYTLQSVMGYANTLVEDYRDLRSLGWLPGSRMYDLLNIRYVVTSDTIKTLPLVYAGDAATGDPKVYENPTVLPRLAGAPGNADAAGHGDLGIHEAARLRPCDRGSRDCPCRSSGWRRGRDSGDHRLHVALHCPKCQCAERCRLGHGRELLPRLGGARRRPACRAVAGRRSAARRRRAGGRTRGCLQL